MIILPTTTDKLQIVTSAAGTIHTVCSYGEVDQATPPGLKPFGVERHAITTATTTDLLGVPGASTTRTPEEITIRNAHASIANDVLIQYNANATLYEIYKITLRAGETLEYIKGVGWYVLAASSAMLTNQNTADVTANAADTYLTGSAIQIPNNRPIVVGTRLIWRLAASKTAAGVAAWVFNIRFGVNGTTADTARVVFTSTLAQTAAVDVGTWVIKAIVRGPIGVSAIVAGSCDFRHHLTATGFSTQNADAYQTTSTGFDITTAGMIVGLSCNPGAAGVFAFQMVSADVVNI